ncbi:hypothetical protein EDC96DRAFT_544486 [Choanephora cucurbitarum]|nr:hypothetical protein EDC96DRAFT_544486 [Choanephora cucurbitarum]
MPDRIPLRIFLYQSISYVLNFALLCTRFAIAVFIWLFLIPVLTTWTWRFHFWTGSHISPGSKEDKKSLMDYEWSEILSDCLQGLSITGTVVVLFVAAYLFRDWVIRNTASIQMEQHVQHPERDRGRQLVTRLEALRQELEQRRNEDEIEDIAQYNNPYANNNSPYEMQNRRLFSLIDETDMPANPPSGTQSPFASWRDYQQGNSNSSLNDHTINHANQRGLSRSTSMLRLQDPLDYFDQASLAQTRSTSPAPEPSPLQPNDHQQENPNDADQEPFSFSENMDSFLEAIGMRGSMLTLIKNAILMTLMINLCLWITVWIPYVIGRSIISIRYVSWMGISMHTIQSMFDSAISPILNKAIGPLYIQVEAIATFVLPNSFAIAFRNALDNTIACICFIFKSIHIILASDDSLLGGRLTQLTSDTTLLVNHDNWEWVRSNIYPILVAIFRRWRQCAIGESYIDRSVCTFTGYVFLISIGSWYLSKTHPANGSTSQAFRQQWVFLKVLFFIFLELVVFPTIYGVLLDISTLPLFTDWSIKTRFHFVLLNPYSGIFLHWFIGTGLVLQSSVLVELIREVVRPGVLYFLPDPKDHRYRPIQDIVEQPVLLLIKRMCHVAAVYFMLILVGMGIVTIIVSKYGGIYPIVWKFGSFLSNPIMSIPIDLLIIQFLLPPIITYLVPREFSRKSATTWWHIVSRYLRLSSYMFGGRYPREEGTFTFESWYGWLCYHLHLLPFGNVAFQKDKGQLVRVPSHDHVPLFLHRQKMIIPVDEVTLEPLDPTKRTSTHPAVTRFGSVDTDTTVVYIPPHFKLRVSIFIFLIWVTGSILVCSITVVPLLLGRHLFAKLQPEQTSAVHDLYSFALGAFVMISLHFTLNAIVHKYQLIRRYHRIVDWHSLRTKVEKILVFVYMVFMFGLAVPLLLGITLDLYLLLPMKSFSKENYVIELYLIVDWALGLAGMNVFHGIICISSLHISPTLREQFMQLNLSNFVNLDVKFVSKNILAPLVTCILSILVLPSITSAAVLYVFAIHDPTLKLLIFRYTYPFHLGGALCLYVAYEFIRLFRYSLHCMRNNVYLVGKRLHNIEE